MTELVKDSVEPSNDSTAYAASLLCRYGFDLGDHSIAQVLSAWQEDFPAAWIRLAIIEALYQGRYKTISVEQILALWQRRSQPIYHFNHEFERLVCNHLPQALVPLPQNDSARSTARLDPTLPYHSVALQLPSFEATAALPDSDTVLALRTLHSKAAADLTVAKEATLSSEQSPMQTYSYALQSDARQPHSSTYETIEPLAQGDIEPTRSSLDLNSSTSEGSTSEGSLLEENTETLTDRTIALTTNQLEEEQTSLTQPIDSTATLAAAASSDRKAPVQSTASQSESIARILQQLDDQELSQSVVLPGFGLMAHTLKPKLRLHLTTRYQPLWLTESSSKQPIDQFTPESEPSGFYSKLKAVAQSPEEPAAETPLVPPEI